MSITAASLRELHRIHSQLADLRGRLERGPHAIRVRQKNVETLQDALDTAHESVKQTRMMADKKQLDLKSSEERIVDWNAKLNTASSNKEYQTLQEQIAAAEMANSVLADEILEALERVDELSAEATQAQQHLQAGQAELARVTKQVEDNTDALRGDIERLEGELLLAEKSLPGDFMGDYRRIINSKGAEGMAPSEEGVCTGCGQQITLNMQNDLAMSRPVFCKACGCLLYVPE